MLEELWIRIEDEWDQVRDKVRRRGPLRLALTVSGGLLALTLSAAGLTLAWVHANREHLPEQLNRLAHSKWGVDFTYGAFRWAPAASPSQLILHFSEVFVRDTLAADSLPPILKAGEIRLRLSFTDLISGKLSLRSLTIQDGRLSWRRTGEGRSNAAFMHKASRKSQGTAPDLPKKIWLRQVEIDLVDSLRSKNYSFTARQAMLGFQRKGQSWTVRTEGRWFVHRLVFRPEQGAFLTSYPLVVQGRLEWKAERGQLEFQFPQLGLEEGAIQVRGVLKPGQHAHIDLRAEAAAISLSAARRMLTPRLRKTLGGYSLDQPLRASFHLSGPLQWGKPQRIRLNFQASGARLQGPGWSISQTRFSGWFDNACDSSRQVSSSSSCLRLSPFQGLVFNHLPFKAFIHLRDLRQPELLLAGRVETSLARLNPLFPKDLFQFGKGQLRLAFRYRGPLEDLSNEPWKAGRLSGRLNIDSAAFDYMPRGLAVRQLNGRASFDEQDLKLEPFGFQLNRNFMQLQGTVHQFFPFLADPKKPLQAVLYLYTPSLNLDYFPRPQGPITSSGKDGSLFASLTEGLLENLNTRIDLRCDRLRYRNFDAREVVARLGLSRNRLQLIQTRMKLAGGQFALEGEVSKLNENQPRVEVKARIDNADISRLFEAFDNFQQDAITARNLRGRLRADIDFQTFITPTYAIVPSSMRGSMHLHLGRGELLEAPGLMKLDQFLFRGRTMSHVQFDTIDNTFRLHGPKLEIEQMNLRSNILVLNVEGIYGFRGGTDLLIGLPLRNLFQKSFSPEVLANIRENGGRGPQLLLRASDEKGEIKIRPVLFPKRR